MIAALPEICDGDIFIHTVISAIEGDPKRHQLWLRTGGSWLPIDQGHQIKDGNGRDRTLVVTSDSEPSWVLTSTARRNYNTKRKARAPKKVVMGLFSLLCNSDITSSDGRNTCSIIWIHLDFPRDRSRSFTCLLSLFPST